MRRIPTASIVVLCLSPVILQMACAPSQEAGNEEATPEAVETAAPKARPGDFVTIPAGEFIMGSNERPAAEKNKPALYEPEHKVDLPAYQISVFEVTNGEFAKFQIESDYLAEGNWQAGFSPTRGDFPVANVTWDDAKAYCEWIGGRLPTEAEWEKAARGPDGLPYPWGEKWDPTKANCYEMGLQNIVKVGQIEADESPYGVRDMMGNVQEWTADKLKAYPNSPARKDQTFSRGYIAARGGSYVIKGGSIALWVRGGYFPKGQFGTGLRCVKDVTPESEQTGEN